MMDKDEVDFKECVEDVSEFLKSKLCVLREELEQFIKDGEYSDENKIDMIKTFYTCLVTHPLNEMNEMENKEKKSDLFSFYMDLLKSIVSQVVVMALVDKLKKLRAEDSTQS